MKVSEVTVSMHLIRNIIITVELTGKLISD